MKPIHKPLIVLGVSGGIAAYKSVEVCRGLTKAGYQVGVALTPSATEMVGVKTFQALTDLEPVVDLWHHDMVSPHTELGQAADLLAIFPATARVISDLAVGRSADPLTALWLASEAPKIIFPAMHTEMWNAAATQQNIETLRSRGVTVIGPVEGDLAGGDVGIGRVVEPDQAVTEISAQLQHSSSLSGINILVSAGATREPIDPVRYITNRSTGRQGHAIAEAAHRRGAAVTVVTSSDRTLPTGIRRIDVSTAAEMHKALASEISGANVFFSVAAVADFVPVPSATKMRKADGIDSLQWTRSVDILAELGKAKKPGQVFVGFSAQDSDDATIAIEKMNSKNVDLIASNNITQQGAGFQAETNHVIVYYKNGKTLELGPTQKTGVAEELVELAIQEL